MEGLPAAVAEQMHCSGLERLCVEYCRTKDGNGPGDEQPILPRLQFELILPFEFDQTQHIQIGKALAHLCGEHVGIFIIFQFRLTLEFVRFPCQINEETSGESALLFVLLLNKYLV